MTNANEFPVHESLDVVGGGTIYRTDEWHKAVVLYQYGAVDTDSPELAVYLWHKPEANWKRKQKYVVRTTDGWVEDKDALERFLPALNGESVSGDIANPDKTLPVSDYYHVAAGETIFKTDKWWKGVTVIDQKGDYETTEVILYVWQQRDGEWKTRQKYPVKRISDWEDDLAEITKHVDKVDASQDDAGNSTSSEDDRETLQRALENRHLSKQLTQETSAD